ncbi:aggregation-promoting factor C-terminal-like domain-containing protein [Cryptosporangium minutisporangium]
MVLVFSAAIGVAVTVLRDTDPDTVQVKEELKADVPVTVATPPPDTGTEQDKPVGAEIQQKQAQQQALDAARSRAADKAEAAQKKAAEDAERAEDERASRSAERSAASDDESESTGSSGDPVPSAPVDCNNYSGNKKTGCALLSEYGFSTSQMSCLDKLWMKESGWRTTAENPSSGAYGIPQSLPGNKMATVASDWRTNPATQIRWGLGYIKDRYGTPCGAWSHSQANGWY